MTQSMHGDYAESASARIAAFVAADLFAGDALVAKGGEVLLRQGFGLANREWNIPHNATGKFRLGSLTKQFTAIAILQLVERGALALDDEIARHYPEAPAAWNGVTLISSSDPYVGNSELHVDSRLLSRHGAARSCPARHHRAHRRTSRSIFRPARSSNITTAAMSSSARSSNG